MICVKENCTCFQHEFLNDLPFNLRMKIKSLLKQPDKLREVRDCYRLTLLHHSVKSGNDEMSEHLIKKGWDVNARDASGVTPLMLAVKARNVKSAGILLKNSADVCITDFDGKSSLQLAFHIRFHESCLEPLKQNSHLILEMILDVLNYDFAEGKSIQFLSNADDLLKLIVVVFGNVEITRFVLENGYPIDYREPQRGCTAFHCAILFARFENAKLLIEHGANIDVFDDNGCSPFIAYTCHFEAVDENAEVLKHFLKHSTRLLRDGFTELRGFLIEGNKTTVMTVLLESSVEVKKYIEEKGSLFRMLINNERANGLELIDELKIEFDVNERTSDGETLLMEFILAGCPKTVEFLLQRGANVNAVTHERNSVLTYTSAYADFILLIERNTERESNLAKILELLLQYGVDDVQSFFREQKDVPLCLTMKVIVAHLAMLGAIEQSSLTESTRQILESKPELKDYFDLCTIQLDEMKYWEVYGTVTLFKLLTEKEEKIVVYARNQEFITAWTDVIDNSSHLEMYYSSTLQRKLTRASETAEIRAQAARAIQMLTGMNSDVYRTIVYEIMSYLTRRDLLNLSEAVKHLQ